MLEEKQDSEKLQQVAGQQLSHGANQQYPAITNLYEEKVSTSSWKSHSSPRALNYTMQILNFQHVLKSHKPDS